MKPGEALVCGDAPREFFRLALLRSLQIQMSQAEQELAEEGRLPGMASALCDLLGTGLIGIS